LRFATFFVDQANWYRRLMLGGTPKKSYGVRWSAVRSGGDGCGLKKGSLLKIEDTT
jgi:hypothetical protein